MTLSLSFSLARSAYFSPPARSRSIRGIFLFYFRLHCRGNFEVARIPRGKRNNYLSRADVEKCQPPPAISYSYPVDVVSPLFRPEKLWARPRFRPWDFLLALLFSTSLSLSLSFSGSLVRINIFKNTKVDERSGGGKEL